MIFVIFSCMLVVSDAIGEKWLPNNISEDAYLNFTQLAEKYGRPCEEFDVVTEDGYILKIFHLTGNEFKKPVLLMHGLLDSADTFIIRGNDSTAVSLANSGHDVWVGNLRGNKYSIRNTKLSPVKDKKEFWNFTFHEMGIHDLPTTIDFVLGKTGKEKLSIIGHSQALAPIAYLQNIGPVLKGVITLFPLINAYFLGLGLEGLLQNKSAANELIQFICTLGDLGYALCEKGIIASIAGDDSEELEPEFFDIMINHFPAGESRKDFDHFVQISNSGIFAEYDYGEIKNQQLYNSTTPPEYDLSNMTAPIVLLAGRNDGFAGLPDVERLKNALPNVVKYHIMDRDKFNHIDFVWGKHINIYLNPLLKDLLLEYA